jgi:hypothetical protein
MNTLTVPQPPRGALRWRRNRRARIVLAVMANPKYYSIIGVLIAGIGGAACLVFFLA